MNVATLLLSSVRRAPDTPALVDLRRGRHRMLTFAELDSASASVAAWLLAKGFSAGDAALILTPPSLEMYIALVGVLRAGGVVMTIDVSAGLGILPAAVRQLMPRCVVGPPRLHWWRLATGRLPRRAIGIATDWAPGATTIATITGTKVQSKIVARADDDPALISFTSGSTGVPKAAIRTHAILAAQREALRDTTAQEGEVDLGNLPIVALANLANGATTVIPAADPLQPGAIDPTPVLAQMARHRVTRITASPSFVERLAEGATSAGRVLDVERIITGGGPVFPDFSARVALSAPKARITAVYGSTEAEPIAHIHQHEVPHVERQREADGAGLLVGAPVACAAVQLIAPAPGTALGPFDGAQWRAMAVSRDTIGEVVVAGAHVVAHYLAGDDEALAKIRVDDVVWHRTGDLATRDADGRLWMQGRLGTGAADAADTADAGALRPTAIETAARAAFPLRQAAALVHAQRRWLCIVPRDGATIDVDAVRATLAWAALDEIRILDTIPVDARHAWKIRYRDLAASLR